jgi:hypothetical protein
VLGQQDSVTLPCFQNLDEAILYTCYLTQAIEQFKRDDIDVEWE